MLNKVRKALKSKEGFTLIELITVIVVLGIILGIGIPKYMKLQAQSEWDADVVTLTNIEKAAELYYTRNPNELPIVDVHGVKCAVVEFEDLVNDLQFDGRLVLKRIKIDSPAFDSLRNSAGVTLLSKNPLIKIVVETGRAYFEDVTYYVTTGGTTADSTLGDGANDWMNRVIGYRP